MVSLRGAALTAALILCVSSCAQDRLQHINEPETTVNTVCLSDRDCPEGQSCLDGQCIDACTTSDCETPTDPPIGEPEDPEPDVEEPTPDPPIAMGGDWTAHYDLDWSEYLGGLKDLGAPIDVVDQVLKDNLDIPLVGDLVATWIDENVPPWVGDLVHVLNGVVHFFQNVGIDTVLTLDVPSSADGTVSGTEAWTRATLEIIDMCPYGELSPDYPACARMPITLDPLDEDYAHVEVDARPFSGEMLDPDQIDVSNREVRIQMARFVAYAIDGMVAWATNGEYTTLVSALNAVVDCAGVRAEAEAYFDESLPAVEMICNETLAVASEEITTRLGDTYAWEVMHFSQSASIADDDGDGIADRLGLLPRNPGEVYDGRFDLLREALLGGTWSAARQ